MSDPPRQSVKMVIVDRHPQTCHRSLSMNVDDSHRMYSLDTWRWFWFHGLELKEVEAKLKYSAILMDYKMFNGWENVIYQQNYAGSGKFEMM